MRLMSQKSKVAIVKGERGFEPVYKALDLIDYKTALAGYSRVLIKSQLYHNHDLGHRRNNRPHGS